MLRRLASATGHALRSSLLLEGSFSSSSTSLLEATSTSSPSLLASAASRIALSSLASFSGRSLPSSSPFSTLSAPAQAAAGLAEFIEPPLKEGEKRVAGELTERGIEILFFFLDQKSTAKRRRRRPRHSTSSSLFLSSPLQNAPRLPNHLQAAPGQQRTCERSPGTTSTPSGSFC